MKKPWTPDRIANLSKDELKSLQFNATERGNTEVAEMCQIELDKRPVIVRSGRSRATNPRLNEIRRSEKNAADALAHVASGLRERFDLSTHKARLLSKGVKQFRAHALTDKAGNAKVGGDKRKGHLEIERYLSYRIGTDLLSFAVVMFKDDQTTMRYQVIGSERLLGNQRSYLELRPYLSQAGVSSDLNVGCEFETFDEAADYFVSLFDRLAQDYPSLQINPR